MQQISILFACLVCAHCSASSPKVAFQATGADVTRARAAAPKMESKADLENLAKLLNPVVGYWDPLRLNEKEFWGQSNEASIGFLRHSEIKHGRVAMAAFVGYMIGANGIYWPWKLTNQIFFSDIAAAGSPPEQWDALPSSAKIQIILFIGVLEYWSETSFALEKEGQKHYMRGGKPGYFPSFEQVPHPTVFPSLYDPFGIYKDEPREVQDRRLLAEVNNGRLAMLGIMGFLAEQKLPGSVPALDNLADKFPYYKGEVMSPFVESDSNLFLVKQMLNLGVNGFEAANNWPLGDSR